MSTVLKELIFGILLLGVVFQLLFVWFTSDKGKLCRRPLAGSWDCGVYGCTHELQH